MERTSSYKCPSCQNNLRVYEYRGEYARYTMRCVSPYCVSVAGEVGTQGNSEADAWRKLDLLIREEEVGA